MVSFRGTGAIEFRVLSSGFTVLFEVQGSGFRDKGHGTGRI